MTEKVKDIAKKTKNATTEEETQKTQDVQKSSAEQLQAEIEKKTAALKVMLEELEQKQRLTQNRSVFLRTLEKLNEYETKIKEKDDFNTTACRVVLMDGNISRNEVLAISNASLLLDFVEFMRGKVTAKIENIEMELLK